MPDQPEIVCLCGSARFLADRILVVNPGGYIGESTAGEIAYARAAGKPVGFTD